MLGVWTIWYVLVVCTSYVPVVLNSCTYMLVVKINYVLDVYLSCMFYIVLCTRSMNYYIIILIIVFTSF